MSNKILNMVRDARLGKSRATAKEVLKQIADQSNDAGTGVWSSYAYIAWCIERDRGTVIRQCKWLKKKGLISSTKRSGTTNLWKIHLDVLDAMGEPYRQPIEVAGEHLGSGGEELGELQDATPLVAEDDPSPSITPSEPDEDGISRIVTDPYGNPLPKKEICEKCEARPKASKKHKYCEKCSDMVKDWYASRAVRTYKKRAPSYNLSEEQVILILRAVGDTDVELYRWGQYLDYWLASGWHIAQAGLGNVIEAFKSRSLDDKMGTPQKESKKSVPWVDARPKEDK